MGPGTRLKEMLQTVGLTPREGCNCEAYAKQMDNQGIDWCLENVEVILDWVEQEARGRGLPFWRFAVRPIVKHACELARRDYKALPSEGRDFEESVRNMITSLRGDVIPRPAGWKRNTVTMEAHRRLLDEAVLMNYEYPNNFRGNGIVTLAGTLKYFPSAYNLCFALRKLGCALPITAFCIGREELDHAMEQLLNELNVEVVDLLDLVGNAPRCLGGWEAKIWAIMKCRYERVLFLDADNIPVVNPSYIFESEKSILWPDLPTDGGFDITEEAFYVTGLPCPGYTTHPKHKHKRPSDYRPVESGQLYINKRTDWNTLNVVKHLNDHSDFWWGGEYWFIYGDKSTFYLAYERTKQPYLKPRPCTWFGTHAGGGFTQYDLLGAPLFQHRCQPTSKIRLTSDNRIDGIINAQLFIDSINHLKSKWKGVIWSWEHQSERDLHRAQKERGDWVAVGLPMSTIALHPNGRINDTRQYHWRIAHHNDRPILMICSDQEALAFLHPDEKGGWSNETVRLMHAPGRDFKFVHSSFELGLWTDVVLRNEYHLPDSLAGLRVLDIGSHVGMFAIACLRRNVGEHWAIEATPLNFAMLHENMRKYPNVKCINVAAWRSDESPVLTRMSMVDGAEHSGGFAVFGQGEYVMTMPFNELMMHTGPIDLLKLDCEGAEWPILFTSDLTNVKAICGEYHARWLDDYSETWRVKGVTYSLDALKELLQDAGFTVRIYSNIPGPRGLGHFYAWRQHESFFKGIN